MLSVRAVGQGGYHPPRSPPIMITPPRSPPIMIAFFLRNTTVKDHISNTKLEKGDHYYIQTGHKDLLSHYNLILRKL